MFSDCVELKDVCLLSQRCLYLIQRDVTSEQIHVTNDATNCLNTFHRR